MLYVSDNYKEEKNIEEMNFGREGKKITHENEKIFAKIVVNNGAYSYYIREYQGLPYDPIGPYSRRNIFEDTKLIKVNKDPFDYYIFYLSTNNSIYLTKTQRGVLTK
jgi:hypothetical protein